MTWLITGGAGYIGSHIVDAFIDSRKSVVVLDNLKSGEVNRLPAGTPFFKGDITSKSDLEKLFSEFRISGVINLAGLKSVEESSRIPEEYFRVNSSGVRVLLDTAKKFGAKYFIQSSTAAVYGNLDKGVAFEYFHVNPISIYGESKLEAEIALEQEIINGALTGTSLRYFNVVGAKSPNLRDTSIDNLFPIVANAIKNRLPIKVFGTDYETRDGSCVRDYVHVSDVADAHLLAAQHLENQSIPSLLNVGTGHGHTVLEVIQEFQRSLESKVDVLRLPRRIGDPSVLTANIGLATEKLGFQPKRDIQCMVGTTFSVE
jgi:UDP-glucose 4-epimerase